MKILINYTLRSVNNIGVDQSVLMRRLVYAFIVRKSTTCKSGFLEKNSVRRNVLTIDWNEMVKLWSWKVHKLYFKECT